MPDCAAAGGEDAALRGKRRCRPAEYGGSAGQEAALFLSLLATPVLHPAHTHACSPLSCPPSVQDHEKIRTEFEFKRMLPTLVSSIRVLYSCPPSVSSIRVLHPCPLFVSSIRVLYSCSLSVSSIRVLHPSHHVLDPCLRHADSCFRPLAASRTREARP